MSSSSDTGASSSSPAPPTTPKSRTRQVSYIDLTNLCSPPTGANNPRKDIPSVPESAKSSLATLAEGRSTSCPQHSRKHRRLSKGLGSTKSHNEKRNARQSGHPLSRSIPNKHRFERGIKRSNRKKKDKKRRADSKARHSSSSKAHSRPNVDEPASLLHKQPNPDSRTKPQSSNHARHSPTRDVVTSSARRAPAEQASLKHSSDPETMQADRNRQAIIDNVGSYRNPPREIAGPPHTTIPQSRRLAPAVPQLEPKEKTPRSREQVDLAITEKLRTKDHSIIRVNQWNVDHLAYRWATGSWGVRRLIAMDLPLRKKLWALSEHPSPSEVRQIMREEKPNRAQRSLRFPLIYGKNGRLYEEYKHDPDFRDLEPETLEEEPSDVDFWVLGESLPRRERYQNREEREDALESIEADPSAGSSHTGINPPSQFLGRELYDVPSAETSEDDAVPQTYSGDQDQDIRQLYQETVKNIGILRCRGTTEVEFGPCRSSIPRIGQITENIQQQKAHAPGTSQSALRKPRGKTAPAPSSLRIHDITPGEILSLFGSALPQASTQPGTASAQVLCEPRNAESSFPSSNQSVARHKRKLRGNRYTESSIQRAAKDAAQHSNSNEASPRDADGNIVSRDVMSGALRHLSYDSKEAEASRTAYANKTKRMVLAEISDPEFQEVRQKIEHLKRLFCVDEPRETTTPEANMVVDLSSPMTPKTMQPDDPISPLEAGTESQNGFSSRWRLKGQSQDNRVTPRSKKDQKRKRCEPDDQGRHGDLPQTRHEDPDLYPRQNETLPLRPKTMQKSCCVNRRSTEHVDLSQSASPAIPDPSWSTADDQQQSERASRSAKKKAFMKPTFSQIPRARKALQRVMQQRRSGRERTRREGEEQKEARTRDYVDQAGIAQHTMRLPESSQPVQIREPTPPASAREETIMDWRRLPDQKHGMAGLSDNQGDNDRNRNENRSEDARVRRKKKKERRRRAAESRAERRVQKEQEKKTRKTSGTGANAAPIAGEPSAGSTNTWRKHLVQAQASNQKPLTSHSGQDAGGSAAQTGDVGRQPPVRHTPPSRHKSTSAPLYDHRLDREDGETMSRVPLQVIEDAFRILSHRMRGMTPRSIELVRRIGAFMAYLADEEGSCSRVEKWARDQ